jgi:hypothetical protein
MTFETAMSSLEGLGDKQPGELILAEDWNALVTQVQAMGEALKVKVETVDVRLQGVIDGDIASLRSDLNGLQTEVAGLATQIGPPDSTDGANLTGRVAALEGLPAAMDALETTVAPLQDQYLVSLSTSETHYLLGEVAVMNAQVRHLDGGVPANRPWVDFISSWGTLRAAAGFSSREGADGRSVSVRCDAQGVARVTVRSEQSGHLSDADEDQFKAILATQIGSSLKDELMLASTTTAPTALVAYQEATRVYEQDPVMQKLADAYFIDYSRNPVGGIVVEPTTRWREYRSAVIAIAKNDSDPTTPDPGRGASSIQVRFRDWLGPWVVVYTADDADDIAIGKDLIAQAVAEANAGIAIRKAQTLIDQGLDDEQGVLHRSKVLKAWGKAADQIDPVDLPDHAPEVVETMKAAVGFQSGMDSIQMVAGGGVGGGQEALGNWMDQSARNAGQGVDTQQRFGKMQGDLDGLGVDLGDKMTALEGGVQAMDGEVKGLGGNIANLNGRLNASETAARQIQSSLNGIEDKVVGIDALDATSVQGRLSEISAEIGVIKTRVGGL